MRSVAALSDSLALPSDGHACDSKSSATSSSTADGIELDEDAVDELAHDSACSIRYAHLTDYPQVSEQRTIYKLTTDQLSARQIAADPRPALGGVRRRRRRRIQRRGLAARDRAASHFLRCLARRSSLMLRSSSGPCMSRCVPIRTGYVEAVATRPDAPGTGSRHGRHARVNDADRARLRARRPRHGQSGLLRTPGLADLARPTSVLTSRAVTTPTPDEDGYIMALVTPSTPPIDPRCTDRLRMAPRRRLVSGRLERRIARGVRRPIDRVALGW